MRRFKSQYEQEFLKLKAINEVNEELKSGLGGAPMSVKDEIEKEKLMKI